jgi:hypothetical protein
MGALSPMPQIELSDEELAALTTALRRLVDEDPFPRAPRPDVLRSALAKLDPKPPPPARGGKRA